MVLSSVALFEVGFVDVEGDVLLEVFSLVAEAVLVVVLVVVVIGEGELVSLGSIVLSFGVVSEVFVLVIEEDSVLLESIVFLCIVLVDAGESLLLGSIVLSLGVVPEVVALAIEEESVLVESMDFSFIVLVDDGPLVSHIPSLCSQDG